jgi:hypothetical protein
MSIATLELLRAIGEFEGLLGTRPFFAIRDDVDSLSAKDRYLRLAISDHEN